MKEKQNKIYYTDNQITIRDMRREDAVIITQEEIAQGWDASIDKYECACGTDRRKTQSFWRRSIRGM